MFIMKKATRMGRYLYPDLEAYIDHNYVEKKREEEYGRPRYPGAAAGNLPRESARADSDRADNTPVRKPGRRGFLQSSDARKMRELWKLLTSCQLQKPSRRLRRLHL